MSQSVAIPATNNDVARFLKQSKPHLKKLKDAFEGVATVKLSLGTISLSDEEEDEKIEYRFRPLKVGNALFSKDYCTTTLQEFLKNYGACTKTFDHDKLAQAKSVNPSLFKEKYSKKESDKLLVEWLFDDDEVIIAGPKVAVEEKCKQFEMNVAYPQAGSIPGPGSSSKTAIVAEDIEKQASANTLNQVSVAGPSTLQYPSTAKISEVKRLSLQIKSNATSPTVAKQRDPDFPTPNEARGFWEQFGKKKSFRMKVGKLDPPNPIGLPKEEPTAEHIIPPKLPVRPQHDRGQTVQELIQQKEQLPAKPIDTQQNNYDEPVTLNVLQNKDNDHSAQLQNDTTEKREANGQHLPIQNEDQHADQLAQQKSTNIEPGGAFFQDDSEEELFLPNMQTLESSDEHESGGFEFVQLDEVRGEVVSFAQLNGDSDIDEKAVKPKHDVSDDEVDGDRKDSERDDKLSSQENDNDQDEALVEQSDQVQRNTTFSEESDQDNTDQTHSKQEEIDQTPIISKVAPRVERRSRYLINVAQKYAKLLDFVWNEPAYFDALNKTISELCILSGSPEELKAEPKNKEKQNPTFGEEVVEKIENFLSFLSIATVPLAADLIEFLFKPGNESWLRELYEVERLIIFDVQENSLIIYGFEVEVMVYEALLKEAFEENEKEIQDRNTWRLLSKMGISFDENVRIDFMSENDVVRLRGRKCFVEKAHEEITAVIAKSDAPYVSELKQNALTTFLTYPNCTEYENFFEKTFDAKEIKCIVYFDHLKNKVVLPSQSPDMHRKGSLCIDEILHEQRKPIPQSFSKNTFSEDAWKSLSTSIMASSAVVVQVEDDFVSLIGFKDTGLIAAAAKLEEFFNQEKITEVVDFNSKFETLHVLKHVPPSLKVAETSSGLAITGLPADVDNFLKAIDWKKSQLEYTAPGLKDYFDSTEWSDFLKLLRLDVPGCAVNCKTTASKTQDFKENPEIFGAKIEAYGAVTVTVGIGDVTTDSSDAIINGVVSDDFDLSRGTVSSLVLQLAGEKIQEECNKATKFQHKDIRITKGYNLPCKLVVHVLTPSSAEELKTRIKKALRYADQMQATSVALPTLGAGGMGIDEVDAAIAISQAIELFADEHARNVKKIKVAVFDVRMLDRFRTIIAPGLNKRNFSSLALQMAEFEASPFPVIEKVVIDMTSDDSEALKKAGEKIFEKIEKQVKPKLIDDKIVSKLDECDQFDIYHIAKSGNVLITIDSASSQITLRGCYKNVKQVSKNIQKLLFKLKKSVTLSKQVLWHWSDADNNFSSLPFRVSRVIEKAFQKNKDGTHSTSVLNCIFDADFANMRYDFFGLSGALKREDSGVTDIPESWASMGGQTWTKVELDSNSEEYVRVWKLFKASNPNLKMVDKIERIQNPVLHKHFLVKKTEVEKHMTSENPVERELFHGTASHDADQICSGGFDRSFAGKNATRFGKGCYFALTSRYAARFAGTGSWDNKCMFLARVLTGDYCAGQSDMRVPPKKDACGDQHRRYDSVVDDAEYPKIFVVFKDSSVYPSYLITFV